MILSAWRQAGKFTLIQLGREASMRPYPRQTTVGWWSSV
jgi:hypothetical protein